MTRVEKAKKYVKRQAYYLSFAILLTNAAFIGAVALQSSVNIADELGITSLAVSYGSCMICNLTVTTFLRKRLGPKLSLIIAALFFTFYTLANIYPTYLTLVTASLFLGSGQALLWSSIPIFISFYGEQYSKLAARSTTKNRGYGYYVRRFTGKFYGILAAYLVIGNISSFVILRFDDNLTTKQEENDSYYGSTTASYGLVTFANFRNESTISLLCGANMCSATQFTDEDTEKEKTKYLINNWTVRLLLFSSYTVLQVASLLILIFALKDAKQENFPKLKDDESISIITVNANEKKEETKIWVKGNKIQ